MLEKRNRNREMTRQCLMPEARLGVLYCIFQSMVRARGRKGKERREKGESVKTDSAGLRAKAAKRGEVIVPLALTLLS